VILQTKLKGVGKIGVIQPSKAKQSRNWGAGRSLCAYQITKNAMYICTIMEKC